MNQGGLGFHDARLAAGSIPGHDMRREDPVEQQTAEVALEQMSAAQRADWYRQRYERYRAAYEFLVASAEGAAAIVHDDDRG